MKLLIDNYLYVGAIILFGIGFMILLLSNNLIKKIIGMNIMDTAVFLLFLAIGYVNQKASPIIINGVINEKGYVNPVPAGLMLTGIVVAVSTTAFMLALTVKLYEKYGTIEIDEIQRIKGGDS